MVAFQRKLPGEEGAQLSVQRFSHEPRSLFHFVFFPLFAYVSIIFVQSHSSRFRILINKSNNLSSRKMMRATTRLIVAAAIALIGLSLISEQEQFFTSPSLAVNIQKEERGSNEMPYNSTKTELLLNSNGFIRGQSQGEGMCQALCRISHGDDNDSCDSLSTPLLWTRLRSKILNASYSPESERYGNPKFKKWVDAIFEFYTIDRLRRSVAHVAPLVSMRKLVEKIDAYQKNQTKPNGANDPLQILVMGGSVTSGRECQFNPVGIPANSHATERNRECSWGSRWGHLIDDVLFDASGAVEVRNMAVGGSQTDLGTLVLEYQLFPEDYPGTPDIVVSGFSVNDGLKPVAEEEKLRYEYEFIKAAKELSCEEGLPMVVMVDDLYGDWKPDSRDEPWKLMKHSGVLAKTMAWYETMGVSYPNVVRHSIYRNIEFPQEYIPLFGGNFVGHLPMGFHLGMAWTMLYNTLNALVDHCNHDKLDSPVKPHAIYEARQELNMDLVPELAPNAPHEEWKGRWEDSIQKEASRCSEEKTRQPGQRPCPYAWAAERTTGVIYAAHVQQYLEPVLYNYDRDTSGWLATGFPTRQPRAGWYAKMPNATFTTRLVSTILPIRTFTIMYLKTYDKDEAVLRVTVNWKLSGTSHSGVFEMSNLHESKTSIIYAKRFTLPSGGVPPGTEVSATYQLIKGDFFKISGMAYCSR